MLFKIEAKDETGMFNDMVVERFDTIEDAIQVFEYWDYGDVPMHIIDVENCRIVHKNYEDENV